ncbi:hypothetical protein ABK040_002316 [Willaertia magna]
MKLHFGTTLKKYHPTIIHYLTPLKIQQNNVFFNQKEEEYQWTIVKSLRISKKIIINKDTIPQLFQLINKDLSKITKLYEINNKIIDCNINFVIKLFSIEKNKKIIIDFIDLDLSMTTTDLYLYNNKKTITLNDRIGFNIKNLSIICEKTGCQVELYFLLSNFYLLESLKLWYEIDDEYDLTDFEISSYPVPIMYNLKTLNIEINIYDADKKNKIITDIVQLAPNLENIKFTDNRLSNKLLEFIAKACPKLKVFNGKNVDINDDDILNLLKALPNLNHLELSFCINVSGLFFIEIDKYGKNLKYLSITRIEEMSVEDDIYFGSGELTNLEYLHLSGFVELSDKFIKSLIKNAPNLKKITGLYSIVKSIDKFNFKNLQSIEIKSKDFTKMFEFNNLKELIIHFDGKKKEPFLTKQNLKKLLKHCLNLEQLHYDGGCIYNRVPMDEETKETLIEILQNPHNWPKLIAFIFSGNGLTLQDLFINNIVSIRPELKTCCGGDVIAKSSEIKEPSHIEFVKFWLMDDKLYSLDNGNIFF